MSFCWSSDALVSTVCLRSTLLPAFARVDIDLPCPFSYVSLAKVNFRAEFRLFTVAYVAPSGQSNGPNEDDSSRFRAKNYL